MTTNIILFLAVGILILTLVLLYFFKKKKKMFFNVKATRDLIIDLEMAMKRGLITEEEFLMICAKRAEDKLSAFLEKKTNKKSKRT